MAEPVWSENGDCGIHSCRAPTEIAAGQGVVDIPLGCGHLTGELLNIGPAPDSAARPLQLVITHGDEGQCPSRAQLGAGLSPLAREVIPAVRVAA
jgi:hypothetical protein